MFKIRQFVKGDFCKTCFGCCRFKDKDSIWLPHILEQEKENLRQDRIKLEFKQGQFICSFLETKTNLCRIYKIRPFECRLYPFLIKKNPEYLSLAVHKSCPFIKERLTQKDFKNYLGYLKNFLTQPRPMDILIKNKDRFFHYPEDETQELVVLSKLRC